MSCADARSADYLCGGHGTCTEVGNGAWACICDTEYTGVDCGLGKYVRNNCLLITLLLSLFYMELILI